MSKKRLTRFLSVCAATVCAASMLSACGGKTGDPNEIDFWFYGSDTEVKMYKAMADKFNETYGASHGYTVTSTSKPIDSYWSAIRTAASTRSGPDVFLEIDDNFKKNVGNGLTGELNTELNAITDIDVSGIWSSMENRYRYNPTTNTSNAEDPIYGYVVDSRPTAIYYNETLFEKAGIKVISVAEEDMEKWNKNEIADARGKKKSDYGLTGNIPARGFYRSAMQYTGGGLASWSKPRSGETLVFNNKIAMNWDEVEDLAMIFSDSSNRDFADTLVPSLQPSDSDNFGFFTEWWFMYGWGVGGDCLTELNGQGDYNFSLLDDTKNYVVADGKSYTAASGKTYAAGEALSIADKAGVTSGQSITASSDGTYTVNGGKLAVSAEVTNAAAAGTLNELPSTREAFERYLRLGVKNKIGGQNGLNVSPKPNQFTNGKSAVNYFISGQLAMLNTYSSFMSEISNAMEYANYKWDIAPTVVYKEFSSNKDDAVVTKRGITASQSQTFGLVSRKASEKKTAAAAFIKWMAGKEAQEIKAGYGFFPNYSTLRDKLTFESGDAPQNIDVFFNNIEWQDYGDWRYLTDYVWVDTWAVSLNEKVRNDLLDYSTWITNVVDLTNAQLKSY